MSNVSFCPNCGNKIQLNSKFCSICGNKIESKNKTNFNESNKNNIKRNKVLNTRKHAKRKPLFVTSAIIVLVGGFIWYFAAQPSKEAKIIDSQPKVVSNVSYPSTSYQLTYSLALAKNGKIIIPLEEVKQRKFMRFDYISNNEMIPILAYLTEDGKVVTAISMCEPCNSITFHIKGSNLICNSCGTTWNLNNLNAVSGSCGKYPPDPIPSNVVGNEIQIDKSLVDNWTRRI